MKLVSGIVDSGFFAQSALSAEVATKDSLGRNISETYLTGVDLTPYQTTADMVNYQTTAGMTAYQSAGEYYSASNPSGFLVADDITGKLDASVYAADSGNFLTAVPDTYLQNTDLSTEDGKVTAISGIPLSAGGDVPEGVMVESGLEYNAVQEISGYNGSAIAQYGAEKQWLQHDDTIVHVANSAQYAFGCNISALQRLMGIDETVLYSGSTTQTTATTTADLNDAWTNYNKIKVSFKHSFSPGNTAYGGNHHQELTSPTISTGFTIGVPGIYDDGGTVFFDRNGFGFTPATPYKFTILAQGSRIGFSTSAAWSVAASRGISDIVVIGIGRKQ